MSLLNSMVTVGDATYYTTEYKRMIEDHILYLRNHTSVKSVPVEPMVSFKYASDFYGLLFKLEISMIYHYAVLRLNGFRNPSDFLGSETNILTIDSSVITRLVSVMKTQIKKSNR